MAGFTYADLLNNDSKIPQPDIHPADDDGNDRDRRAIGKGLNEAEAEAVALGDAGDGEVCRRPIPINRNFRPRLMSLHDPKRFH